MRGTGLAAAGGETTKYLVPNRVPPNVFCSTDSTFSLGAEVIAAMVLFDSGTHILGRFRSGGGGWGRVGAELLQLDDRDAVVDRGCRHRPISVVPLEKHRSLPGVASQDRGFGVGGDLTADLDVEVELVGPVVGVRPWHGRGFAVYKRAGRGLALEHGAGPVRAPPSALASRASGCDIAGCDDVRGDAATLIDDETGIEWQIAVG